MAFETFTTTDKAKRDAMFQEFRSNGSTTEERRAVKFSGVQLEAGSPAPFYVSNYSVAYPVTPGATAPKHGSARNPKKFPPRKVVS